MSQTEIYIYKKRRKSEILVGTVPNAWAGSMAVWDALSKKYINSKDSIIDTEYIKIDDWKTYKIITYKTGYHELYCITQYNYADKNIQQVKYNDDFISRLRELQYNNNDGDCYWHSYNDFESVDDKYYCERTNIHNNNQLYYDKLRQSVHDMAQQK